MTNPLLQDKFNTPFETIPFGDIKLEHYKPAFEEAIRQGQAEIDAIVNNAESPNFSNTIEALEKSGKTLDLVSSVFFNLNSAETSPEMQQLAQEVSPLLSEHSSNVLLNEGLFARVKDVYEQGTDGLSDEQQMLLTKTYKSFARNGALLEGKAKERIREISKELGLKSLTFGENVLAESNAFQLHITEEKELAGLPESAIEAAALFAKSKEKEGWLITLDYPSYIPFITYADNRELREEIYKAFTSKANQGNEYDNKQIVLDIAKLKEEKAKLLGYESHAAYVLEERMAKSATNVLNFLDKIYQASYDTAKKEAEELQAFANTIDGPAELQKWDVAYYSEKLKQHKLSFDEEKLKPYFKLENVIDGVFQVAQKLYGLQFVQRTDIPVYHEDVKTYEVQDQDGRLVAVFYGDFFPREGKRQGAWMTAFKGQYKDEEGDHRPHIANVCNFTKPTETKPSLLTFNEVTTLFHEFGHALHGMLAATIYGSLSGTNVLWDFVELPSQVLENWCYEKECLDLFAKHYETGETIPQEYIEQIKAGLTFRSGTASLRQISFGQLDMNWHGQPLDEVNDVKEFEAKSMADTELYPAIEGSGMSTQFSHIFQGGYSAGYYSYKWAEVLDADAFESFKENGLFDKETANLFKNNVLSQGGTKPPEVLYKQFKGRDADPKALLKRSGLL